MLTRHLDGRETILARGYDNYTPGEEQHWRVEVEGGVITPYIDGKKVFGTEIEDRTLDSGTVGLYSWASEDLAFDDVLVTELGEASGVTEIIGTDGNDRLVGTDGDDILNSLGGRSDVLTGLGGADVFDFSDTTSNGVREVRRITDYNEEEDSILLGPDVEVDRVRETGVGTLLYLDGDQDLIILEGISGLYSDGFF